MRLMNARKIIMMVYFFGVRAFLILIVIFFVTICKEFLFTFYCSTTVLKVRISLNCKK